jgi:hypothetical protein
LTSNKVNFGIGLQNTMKTNNAFQKIILNQNRFKDTQPNVKLECTFLFFPY